MHSQTLGRVYVAFNTGQDVGNAMRSQIARQPLFEALHRI
jgi:hypothetical protein